VWRVACPPERTSLEEALKEAMDGRAEAERVGAAIREAEAHQKKLEYADALEKVGHGGEFGGRNEAHA
jgi:hypothetical protein